jgi:hypothetical protein
MVNGAASGIGLPMATEFNFFIVQKSHLEATNPTLAELFFLVSNSFLILLQVWISLLRTVTKTLLLLIPLKVKQSMNLGFLENGSVLI